MPTVRILKSGGGPDPSEPQMPNTYDPPRVDAARSGWNHYFPANSDELAALAAGTGVTRPAVIYLDPAVTYTQPTTQQNIVFEPTADDDQWLYVMPLEANYANIANEGTRVDIAGAELANMPTITSNRVNTPTICVAKEASKIRFVGLEITHEPTSTTSSLIWTSRTLYGGFDDYATSEAEWSSEIIFDRCYIHAPLSNWGGEYRYGLSLVGRQLAAIECYMEGFRQGTESVCVWMPWACRQVTVWNNYLESVNINIFTGGTGDPIAGQHEDIDVRYNDIRKSPRYDPSSPEYVGFQGGLHKNLMETKGAVRFYFAFNYLHDQFRIDDSQGAVFTIKNLSQSDTTPWKKLTDVIIEWNEVRNVPLGIKFVSGQGGYEISQTARIAFRDNLIVANNAPNVVQATMCSASSSVAPPWNPTFTIEGLWYYRNTIVGWLNNEPNYTAAQAFVMGVSTGGEQCNDYQYKDNVTDGGNYGWFMSGQGGGDTAVPKFASSYEIENNISYNCKRVSTHLPTGVTDVGSITNVGFDQTTDPFGSWRITGPYSGIGVDYDILIANTAIAKSGVRF